ncbi:MAG: hypothetical protein JSS83_04575 [Cyanobacteria bacterium SZAS LIN-3]|nr:hypothetical protein [Cyanobacteria bacterium SZAS LIN-3]
MTNPLRGNERDSAADQPSAELSTSEKLANEANLLLGAVARAPQALADRAREATGEKLGETGVEVAKSVAVGAAFALALRKPQIFGQVLAPYVEGAALNAGKILGVVAAADVGTKVGVPAYEVWKDPRTLEQNKAQLGKSLGGMAFDYPLMAASGLAGFSAGAKLAKIEMGAGFGLGKQTESMALRPIEPPPSTPHTFEKLTAQMKAAQAGEQSITTSIREENFLGRGSNGAVYKLDFTKDFVVKAPEYAKSSSTGGKLEEVADFMPGHNVGQPVAKMGDYLILKKQEGFPAGGPGGRARREMTAEAAEALFARSAKTSAELPQSAYDELARTMMALEKHGLQFDPSKPGNILIDPVGKRFNLVDISPTSAKQPYQHTVSDIIVPLADNYFVGSVLPDKGAAYQSFLQQIIAKATVAAKNAAMHERPEPGSSLSYSYKLAGLKPPGE